MSWFSDAANWIEDTATQVGEIIADGVETAGNAAQDALNAAGDALSNVPVVGGALETVMDWFGAVASGVGDLLGAAIVGIATATGGLLGGTLKVIGGILTGDLGLLGGGLVDILATAAGAVIGFGGKVISLVQSVFGMESQKRALTTDEITLLKRIYWESLAIYDIRIITGRAGIFGLKANPFTLGNTIYMKNTSAALWTQTLVHESTHVWQYQHVGTRYTAEALGAQFLMGTDASGKQIAYEWQKELPKPWSQFNKEAQASLVEDVYLYAGLTTNPAAGNGLFFDADGAAKIGDFNIAPNSAAAKAGLATGDFTAVANDAVTTIRGAGNPRRSVSRLTNVLPRLAPKSSPGVAAAPFTTAQREEDRG